MTSGLRSPLTSAETRFPAYAASWLFPVSAKLVPPLFWYIQTVLGPPSPQVGWQGRPESRARSRRLSWLKSATVVQATGSVVGGVNEFGPWNVPSPLPHQMNPWPLPANTRSRLLSPLTSHACTP